MVDTKGHSAVEKQNDDYETKGVEVILHRDELYFVDEPGKRHERINKGLHFLKGVLVDIFLRLMSKRSEKG